MSWRGGASGYVLAVASSHRVTRGFGVRRADHVATTLPRRSWQRASAGAGVKGQRFYSWALIDIDQAQPGCRWLLIRRNHSTGAPSGGLSNPTITFTFVRGPGNSGF